MIRAKLSQEEIHALKEKNQTVFNRSSFSFLNSHRGLRPKSFHLVIGMPSGGKSTLRNSLIFDFVNLNKNKTVFLWLSEESVESFKTSIAFNPELNRYMDNVLVFSERDEDIFTGNPKEDVETFAEHVFRAMPDFFIFDNITTSRLYGSDFKSQDNFSNELKRIFEQSNCAPLFFAHTSSKVKGDNKIVIDMNDIRGSKNIVNLAEYLYVLQSFDCDGYGIFTTLRTTKHRDQSVKEKLHIFNYNAERKFYDQDRPIPFKKFKEICKKHNRF
ncbi:MAG: hypothetical protein KJO73_09100 [Croceitalea sp.]|nr:hypothetical protein [Croceitalea sp.]